MLLLRLVALKRELLQQWPHCLTNALSARYRDNFFVVVSSEWTTEQMEALGRGLTALLLMPVGLERCGRELRCLETRLRWRDDVVSAVLAYRTDADRQGESQDVTSWPEWKDPRTGSVLNGFLSM